MPVSPDVNLFADTNPFCQTITLHENIISQNGVNKVVGRNNFCILYCVPVPLYWQLLKKLNMFEFQVKMGVVFDPIRT
jgi:hypothetical protein